MKRSNIILTCLLALTGFLWSCSDDRPDDMLSEETYKAVFSELAVLNQFRDEQLQDVSREYIESQIYAKYGITKEKFMDSHMYYQQDAEKQTQRLELIVERLERERDTIQAYVDSLEESRSAGLTLDLEPDTLEFNVQEPDSL